MTIRAAGLVEMRKGVRVAVPAETEGKAQTETVVKAQAETKEKALEETDTVEKNDRSLFLTGTAA
jgi:DNA-binding FadR family transcriptional regulator